MSNPIDNARKIYNILQRGSSYTESNIDSVEDNLISSFAYYINNVVNLENFFYVTADNSPFTVTQSNAVVSCNTEDGDVTIVMPDVGEIEGFNAKIVHYEGDGVVTVTTESGIDPIGGATTQLIRNFNRAITIVSQTSSSSPEYLIVQDSRGKLDNRIRITKPSDFGVIDSTKVYFIDGVVDMGDTSIVAPPTGITIDGFGFGVSKLISSADNFTLFSNGGGTVNGDVFITNCEIEVTGTNSKVFDVNNSSSGFAAIELNTVNFNNCTNVGTITGYRQALIRNSGYFGCSDGITFDGTWIGGARIETFIVRGFGSSGTMFGKGASLSFQNRFVSDGNLEVPSGSIGYDFEEANFASDGLFQLSDGNFTGAGTYINGITEASTKSRFKNNNGITNTFVGAAWSITTSAATTITGTGDANRVKLAGTTTTTNNVWFTQASNNALSYDSALPTVIDVHTGLSLISGNNNQIKVILRHWDDSASSYVDISSTEITTNGSGRAENVVLFSTPIAVSQNDRVEIWVQNNTSATDITGVVGGQLVIYERQS